MLESLKRLELLFVVLWMIRQELGTANTRSCLSFVSMGCTSLDDGILGLHWDDTGEHVARKRIICESVPFGVSTVTGGVCSQIFCWKIYKPRWPLRHLSAVAMMLRVGPWFCDRQ